jgi:hypothetical protein
MRQGTNNRRSRGRGGGGGGGGRKQPGGRFQSFDSNGPSGRLRGNASQLYEKYQNLGRDASSSDRIVAENLLQHAEHYFRVMNAAAAAAAANSGDGQPRPRANGGDGQPVVEPAAAQPTAPHPQRDDSAPVKTAAVPTTENADDDAVPEVAEAGATEPAPDVPKDEPAPKKTVAKPRKRAKSRSTAAKGAEGDGAEPTDSDQELAS